jgi:hypothetical protein
VVEPAATFTEAGTVSTRLLAESVTAEPLVGAACDKVTVQFVPPPDVIVDGVHCRADTVSTGVTDTDAVAELPFSVAVTVTACLAVTVPPAAVKVAIVEPAPTFTEAGTVRDELLAESATEEPPEGRAAFDNVTVQTVCCIAVLVWQINRQMPIIYARDSRSELWLGSERP